MNTAPPAVRNRTRNMNDGVNKRIVLVCVFLLFCYNASAQMVYNHSIGHLGFSINYNTDKKLFAGFSFDYGYFSFENVQTGLGIELNPLRYSREAGRHSLTMLNAAAYWNLLALGSTRYLFTRPVCGPFIAVNYGDLFHIKDFVYRYGLRVFYEKDTWAWWSAELGCKNVHFEPAVYGTITINILGLLLSALWTSNF